MQQVVALVMWAFALMVTAANSLPSVQQQQQLQTLHNAWWLSRRNYIPISGQRERRQIGAAVTVTGSNSDKSKKHSKSFELDCLNAHNKYRRLHQAGELIIDNKIKAFAQKRADHIAASDGSEFKHPPDLPFGENLAWHSRASTSCSALIKMWYDELDLYNFKAPSFTHEAGHFTQLVWRDTKRVGCASAVSQGPRGGVYLVCNYDPPGNFLGEFPQNVLKPKNSPAPRLMTTPVPTTPSPSTSTMTSFKTVTTTQTAAPATSAVMVTPSAEKALIGQGSNSISNSSTAPTSSTTKKPEDGKKKNKGKKKKNKKNKNKNKKNKGKRDKNGNNNSNNNNKKQIGNGNSNGNGNTTTLKPTTNTPQTTHRPL